MIINRAGKFRGKVRRSQFEIRRVSRLWRKSCNRSRLRSRLLHRSWKALEFDKLSCSLKFYPISLANQIVCLLFSLTKIPLNVYIYILFYDNLFILSIYSFIHWPNIFHFLFFFNLWEKQSKSNSVNTSCHSISVVTLIIPNNHNTLTRFILM